MTTELVFRGDWYAQSTAATVVSISKRRAVILDRTVFYPTGGGQPGDSGALIRQDGSTLKIVTAVWDDGEKTIVAHVPEDGSDLPAVGETVTAALDWPIRYDRMRMHTALHLLSVAIPLPVTGGAIGDGEGRLDFDMPEPVEREAVQAKLDALLAGDAMVSDRWITDAELDANPGLVKTMSVQPPRGSGRIRLVDIAGLDLQPCGGTHVRRTGEIGHADRKEGQTKPPRTGALAVASLALRP
jgi:misacylated tRNA(Ala) deacylase